MSEGVAPLMRRIAELRCEGSENPQSIAIRPIGREVRARSSSAAPSRALTRMSANRIPSLLRLRWSVRVDTPTSRAASCSVHRRDGRSRTKRPMSRVSDPVE